jgi:hypothetical protein
MRVLRTTALDINSEASVEWQPHDCCHAFIATCSSPSGTRKIRAIVGNSLSIHGKQHPTIRFVGFFVGVVIGFSLGSDNGSDDGHGQDFRYDIA